MEKQELMDKIKRLPSVLGWDKYGAKVMVAKGDVLELVRQLADEEMDQQEPMARIKADDYDVVSKPKHYHGKYGLEAMTVVDNFIGDLVGKSAYCWGNVVKYLLRFQQKNGLEDLKKARQHLDWLIAEMEKEK